MVVLIINEKTDQQRSSEITSSKKNEKNWNILRQTTTITTNIRTQLTFFAAPSEPFLVSNETYRFS